MLVMMEKISNGGVCEFQLVRVCKKGKVSVGVGESPC